MKQRHVKQLLILSTTLGAIYCATSVAAAADTTGSGAASGAISAASGGAAASSAAGAAGAAAGRASIAEPVAASRLASEFAAFAGSRENALSLVRGLRDSTPVALTAGGQAAASSRLIFSPPTKPMGYGEVSRALSLTRSHLAAQGIINPTPAQLQMALMGGATTSGSGQSAQTAGTAGVLQLRRQGMGWGQIAQSLNVSPSGHLATDGQVSAQVPAVTGQGSASVNTEDAVVNSRAQVGVGARTGLPQGGGVGGGVGLGIGGAAGAGHGLGLGR